MAGRTFSNEQVVNLEGETPKKRTFSHEQVIDLTDPSATRAANAGNGVPIDFMKAYKDMGNKMANSDSTIPDYLTKLIDTGTLHNLQYSPKWKQAVSDAEMNSPTASKLGSGTALAGLGLGSAILSPAGIPAAMAIGAGQGGLEKPEGDNLSLNQDLYGRAKNAGKGAAVTLGLAGLGKGLSKVGDVAMQKAIGAKDLISGMGNRIADEGLLGTRGMMRGQIQREAGSSPNLMQKISDYLGMTNKLPAREASLNHVMPQMKGSVSVVPSVDAISREGAMLVPKNPNIPISSGNEEAVKQIEKRALEAAARGNQAPIDTLDVARKIDRAAYQGDIPAGRLAKKLDRLDSGAMRGELKNEAEKQGLPQVRKLLGSEQALIHARNSMERPEGFQDAIMRLAGHGLLSATAGGGTYYATHDPYKALAVAAATTPAGLSTIGQLGTKGGQSIPYLTPAVIEAFMRSQQGGQQ